MSNEVPVVFRQHSGSVTGKFSGLHKMTVVILASHVLFVHHSSFEIHPRSMNCGAPSNPSDGDLLRHHSVALHHLSSKRSKLSLDRQVVSPSSAEAPVGPCCVAFPINTVALRLQALVPIPALMLLGHISNCSRSTLLNIPETRTRF